MLVWPARHAAREHEGERRPKAGTSQLSSDHRGDHLPSAGSSRPVAELHLAKPGRCSGLPGAAPLSRILEPQSRRQAPLGEGWPGQILRAAQLPPPRCRAPFALVAGLERSALSPQLSFRGGSLTLPDADFAEDRALTIS